MAAAVGDHAQAQGNLDASYTISFVRIPVGEITATVVFGDSEYAISARARAGGVMNLISVDGEGSFTTRGTIKDGHPVPTNFTSKIVSNTGNSDVTMVLDESSVRELAATPPPSQDRVSVTAANRRSIVDPLTAVLFSTAAAGETLSQDACRRTLPIFDGHQRYDLKLAFKRMDKVTAEKGYAGPVVVCSVSYEPIAGHRASIPLVKYLSEGREMEMALAPIAGTRLLAPFRLSVVSMLAYKDLVSAAIGFNPTRGDQLTVENISFEGAIELIEQPTFFEKQAPVIVTSLRYLIVPVVFIILYLLFLRPVQKSVLAYWAQAGPQLPGNTRALPRLPAPIQTPMTIKQLEAQLSGASAQDSLGGLQQDYAPVPTHSKMEMMRKRVVEHAQADPETVARMVRVWLSDEKNK